MTAVKPPLYAPATDAEWARSIMARLRQLETNTTTRIGDWVIHNAEDGTLSATKPGEGTLVLAGDTGEDTVADTAARGNYVTADDVAEAVTGAGGGLDDVADWLNEQWQKFLTPQSPLDWSKLLGLQPDWLLPSSISLGALTDQPVNQIADPKFDQAIESSSGRWSSDPAVYRSSSHCAKVTANGQATQLRSNVIKARAGQIITVTIHFDTKDLVGSGNDLLALNILPYTNTGTASVMMGSPIAIQHVGTAGLSTSDWAAAPAGAKMVTLTGSWVVTGGYDGVALLAGPTDNAASGDVYMDDAVLTLSATTIPQGWITDLTNDALEWTNGITTATNWLVQISQIFDDQVVTPINAYVQTVKDWFANLWKPNAATTALEQTRALRKAQNDDILSDWFHVKYPVGAITDTAATLVGGKRTWWGAYNDNWLLTAQRLGLAPIPPDPNADIGGAVTKNSAKAAQVASIFNGEVVTPIDSDVQKVKDYNTSITGAGPAGTVAPTSINDQIIPAQVAGPEGSTDLTATVLRLFNELTHALKGNSDGELATLAQAAQALSDQAGDTATLAAVSAATLAIRTNAPINAGLDNTVQSNMNITDIVVNSSVELYFNPVGLVRITKSATIGAIKFTGIYNTGTDQNNPLYINVFRVDYANSMLRYLYSTGDVHTMITSVSGSANPKFQRLVLPGPSNFDVMPGDVIAVEFSSQFGTTSGLRRMGGASVIHTDPNALTTTFGARFTRPTQQATVDVVLSSLTLQGSAPYVGLEITNTPADYVPIDKQEFLTTASSGATWNMPVGFVAGDLVDLIAVGAGGGGGFQNSGAPGSWATRTLVIGTDIPVGASLKTVCGLGGTHTIPARDGSASVVSHTTLGTLLTAAGGAEYANPNSYTQSPGNTDFPVVKPTRYFGGGNVGLRQKGGFPGGGGCWTGDINASYNTFGANGKIWIVTRQAT